MKVLTALLTLVLALPAFADVNRYHARNVLKGSYRFSTQAGQSIEFSVSDSGEVTMVPNEDFYEASAKYLRQDNGLGPDGLTVLNVQLSGGSDEQTATTIIRIYPKQEEGARPALLDVVEVTNDGPNSLSSARVVPRAKLYKLNAKGEWVQVQVELAKK